ncbi:16827_t:CDS:1, partial [Racocetra fulgida]
SSQSDEETIQSLINQLPYNSTLNANEYINIDNLDRDVDLTNEEIIDIIQNKTNKKVEKEPVTIENAVISINNILQFVEHHSELEINTDEKQLLY